MKKVLYILGIIILAAIFLGAGIILRNRLGAPAGPAAENSAIPEGGLPSAGLLGGISENSSSTTSEGQAAAVSPTDTGIFAFTVLPDGSLFYVRRDGQIVRKNSSSSTLVSTLKIADILGASFSFDGRRTLIKSGSADNPRWSVFDIQKNSWRQLSLDARDAYWSPADYRIAYFARKTNTALLSTLDLGADSSRAKTLLTLNGEDLDLNWAASDTIFLGERGSASVSGKLWRYDFKSGGLTLVRDNIFGARLMWGHSYGLLFETLNGGYGGKLSLLSPGGSQTRNFSFLTLPVKCSFFNAASSTSELLACAVPADTRGFGTAALPDAYEKGGLQTADNIFLLNPQSGSYKNVSVASNLKLDVESLRVIGNTAYLLDRLNGRIWTAETGDYSALLASSSVWD